MDLVLAQEDLAQIEGCLQRVLEKSGAHDILLVKSSGQLLCVCGDQSYEDSEAMAALAAANFGATAAIAQMLGEERFSLLFHRGIKEHIHFAPMGDDYLLVTVFDNRVSLGLIRLHAEQATRRLIQILETVLSR